MNNDKHLVMVNAVNFDQVMDDTDQISIRRGAGLMLRQAPKEVETTFKNVIDQTASTGASIGVFLLKANANAQQVVSGMRRFLQQKFPHLTFVVVSEAHNDDYNDYRTNLEKLFAQAKIAQLQQLSLAHPQPVPGQAKNDPICYFDHVRPAVPKTDTDNILGEQASRSSLDRFNYGRDQRNAFYRQALGKEMPDTPESKLHFTTDLKQLCDHQQFGNLDNKMALVYFDGNQFTDLQKKHCKSIKDQSEFDQQMQGNHREFLQKLIDMAMEDENFQTCMPENSQNSGLTETSSNNPTICLRLEVLMWGGDEFLLIVPAWQGMAVMQLFLTLSRNWTLMGSPIKYDGGLVFCAHNTPIVQVRDLARELADGCKTRRKSQDVKTASMEESHWDYVVLESVDYPCEPIVDYQRQRYGCMSATRASLAAIGEVAVITNAIKQSISKRQLYALARELVSTEKPQSLGYYDQFKRIKTLLGSDEIKKLDHKLKKLFPGTAEAWRWLHLLELYDYLAPQRNTCSPQPEDHSS